MNDSKNDSKIDETQELARERTILAYERTFLSWLRTGLAGVGGGIAIIRLLTFSQPLHQQIARFAGHALMLWGLLIFLLAFADYRQSYRKYRANISFRKNLFLLLLVVSLLAILVFLFVVI